MYDVVQGDEVKHLLADAGKMDVLVVDYCRMTTTVSASDNGCRAVFVRTGTVRTDNAPNGQAH